jgi:cellulose synthase/poly-beta-1,6-N-acetylglucosamine synthase-like glycosyltransferase
VLVPLFREAAIVPRLISVLDRLSYPHERLQILLLLEEEDWQTRAKIEELQLAPHMSCVIAPKAEPQTKPRALNIGLSLARGALVTIYDAEDDIEPQQLREVAALFARASQDLACVQCPLHIDNAQDSWIAALFALEYAALFDILDPGLARLGLPLPLGGTSNHFRIDVLRELHGWDSWNVTEDADMGVRLARHGYRTSTLSVPTHEEAPARITGWIGQRKRWMKGWLQTVIVLLRHPLRLIEDLGPIRALSIVLLLLGGVMGPLVGIWLMGLILADALMGSLLHPVTVLDTAATIVWCLIAVAGGLLAAVPLWLGARQRGLGPFLIWLPLLPAYHALLSYAALLGIIDYLRRPHYWDKTDHGLAVHSLRNKAHSVDLTDPAA